MGEAKGNRREKKEIAAARETGKTETALNPMVSLPTFANSRPFALHLEAEEVGQRFISSHSLSAVIFRFCRRRFHFLSRRAESGHSKSKLLLN